MRDKQLASDSTRSRTVPDVLFVDEEGNPIEAGHENILYTDENGNEIAEEIAISLLESGKYIDSRDFYQDIPLNNEAEPQPSFYPPHASLPASAFGSLSKSTGVYQMQMEMLRKEEDLNDSQAKIFAQVQAEMREILKREEELAQIEADANRNTLESRTDNLNGSRYSDSTLHQSRYSQQTPTNAGNDVKDGNESQYTTDIVLQDSTSRFTELEYTKRYTEKTDEINEPTAVSSTRYSDSGSHFSKSQSQRRLPQPPPKKSDSILDFNDSYLGGKKKPESLNESSYFVQDESYGEHDESYGGGSGMGLALGGAHNESLHRLSKTSLSSTLQDHQQYQGTAVGSTISGYNNQKDCTNCSTPFTGVDYHNLFDSTMSNYRAESTTYTPPPAQHVQNECRNRQAPCYNSYNNRNSEGGYVVEKARQVGQLSGNQIIKCLDKIDLSQFEKYYDLIPSCNQQSNDDNENDDLFSDGLFKDELVDIDFGVIDAFTSALNAQINAEKNMADNKQQSNLQFPSHVLTSKYATFLDTQIFLSDTSGNEKQNNNNKCNNGCNSGITAPQNYPNDNNQNGISFQLLSSLNELDQSTFNNTAINNLNDDEDEEEDDDDYSRSNSCGSFGDCKSSQVGAGIGYGLRGGEGAGEYYNSRQSVASSNYNIINNSSNPQNSSFINNSHINNSINNENNPNSSYIDLVKSKQSVSSSTNDIYNLKNLSIHNR